MTQPDTSTKNGSVPDGTPPGNMFSEIVDRLSYAIGLGTVMFIVVVALPTLLWPRELGQYLTGYTYILVLVIAFFCVPQARRYMPDVKPRFKRER